MTFVIRKERVEDDFAVNKIIENAFGPGRFAKSAYRFRDNKEDIADLAFVAENHLGYIVATIRYWYFCEKRNILLLGPVAVEKGLRNMGLGENLMYASLEAAKNMGFPQVVLIGDPNYYSRFGFTHKDAEGITFPTPIDPYRLLGKKL